MMVNPDDLGIGVLFERIRLAMIVAHLETGCIVLWNSTAESVFGYTSAEVIGLPLTALMPERLRGQHTAGMARYRVTRSSQIVGAETPLVVTALRKGGEEITVELSVSAVDTIEGGENYVLAIVRDITERSRAEALSTGQQYLLELVARGTALPEVLETLVRFIEVQSPEVIGSILLLDDDGVHLRHGATPRLPESYNGVISGVAIGPEAGSCGAAAFLREAVVAVDIESDYRWKSYRELALAHGLHACWSTPIFATTGRVLGTFAMYYRQPRAPLNWDLQLIDVATRIAGVAIERQRAEDSLRSREAQLLSVLSTAPVALITIDREGTIIMALGALHLLGMQADALIGRSVFSSMAEHGEVLTAFTEALSGQPQSATIEHQERTLEVRWLPYRDPGGTLTEVIGVVTDVTERARDQEIAEQARRAAEDLARLRSDFVASVSHELRTPLTAIIGYSELLEARWPALNDTERRARLDLIRVAAQRQQRLVDDLLLISQVDSGTLRLLREPVEVTAVLTQAISEVEGTYRGQQITVEGAVGDQVLADPGRTLQVLINLLDNAAKYSPEGSTINVQWHRKGSMQVVRVQDHGNGIPEEERERLFTRFGRLPGSRTRAGRVGTGLGLYLSRNFARAMGGDLELEASGPLGSIFQLRLPAL